MVVVETWMASETADEAKSKLNKLPKNNRERYKKTFSRGVTISKKGEVTICLDRHCGKALRIDDMHLGGHQTTWVLNVKHVSDVASRSDPNPVRHTLPFSKAGSWNKILGKG